MRISHMQPVVFALLLIVALVSLMLPTSVFAMGKRPDDKIAALKKRCDDLSKETGEPHYYGEGKITLLMDYILPAGSDHNPIFRDFRSYIAKFDPFPFERTYIKTTRTQWKALPPLQKNRHYGFCYTIIGKHQQHSAINHPETMLLLEE